MLLFKGIGAGGCMFKSKIYLITLLFGCLGVLMVFQNCGQSSSFSDSNSDLNSSTSFAEEDDIWFRLESARIKIKQLNAIDGFSDNVSIEVLEGQTPKGLAAELGQDVSELDDLILVQNVPTNSSEVIKRYASLIDLLSKARDMLLAYYMHIGFDNVAKDIQEAKDKLQSSIELLASSHQALQLSHTKLQSEVTEQDARMRAMRLEMINKMKALEAKLSQKISRLQTKIEASIANLNKDLMERIAKNSLAIDGQSNDLQALEARVKDIEDKVKPQVEYLVRLTEETRAKLDEFAAAFEELRTAGSETYSTTLAAWSCTEDLDDRQGQENLGLSPSVSEKCVNSKEETLYAICVERYPTFCGPCAGKTMAQCNHWNDPQVGLTAREKLEILINIRQEIAIEHLAQQTEIQRQAIYGSNSCQRDCLELVDGKLKNSCSVSDLNQCGIEGKLLALKVNDDNILNQIGTLSSNIDNRMNNLEDDFSKAKEYSNQRFAELKSYVDQELSRLENIMDSRFAQVASALSGLPFVSESIKEEVDRLTVEATVAEQKAAIEKALIASSLAHLPGFSHLSANEINILLETDIEGVLKVISEGSIGANGAVGSLSSVMISLMKNTFEGLNADQTNMAEYNARLKQIVSGVCPANALLESPFTNVVGRDSMEIIAIGAARRVILGDGAKSVGGNKTIFDSYQRSLVKGSQLQQAFFAAAFDYRKDISISVPQNCLNAIDQFALEVLSTNVTSQPNGAGSIIALLFSDADLMADLLAIHEQTSLVMQKLAGLEETILSRAVVDSNSDEFKNALMDISLKLISTGTSRIISKIKSSELTALLAAQRDVADSAFQAQFDQAINTYISEKHKLAAALDEAMSDITQLQKDMVDAQGANAKLQAQMKKLGAAMGYLQAQQVRDRLNNQAVIDDLKNQIANITRQLEQIQEGQSFDPVILAVKHTFDNTGGCSINKLSAMAFPTSKQFVGGYLVCKVNFRIYSGNGTSNVWGFGRNSIAKMWFKVWGSATDIDVELTMNGQNRKASLNFQNLQKGVVTSQGNHKVMLASGSAKSGGFMMNVPSLFAGISNSSRSFGQKVYFTPKNRVNGKVGKKVTYSSTFYSPLVLSFNKQGMIDTLPINEGVEFDLMANGRTQKTGWVKADRGAFLVRDINKNNIIDDGKELFGQATRSKEGKTFDNGFAALAQFDSNNDGRINSKDKVYGELKLWFDLNADGVSQTKELKTLAEMKVTEIRLEYKDVAKESQNNRGNKVLLSSTFIGPKSCGQEGCKVYDIFFNNVDIYTDLASR